MPPASEGILDTAEGATGDLTLPMRMSGPDNSLLCDSPAPHEARVLVFRIPAYYPFSIIMMGAGMPVGGKGPPSPLESRSGSRGWPKKQSPGMITQPGLRGRTGGVGGLGDSPSHNQNAGKRRAVPGPGINKAPALAAGAFKGQKRIPSALLLKRLLAQCVVLLLDNRSRLSRLQYLD
jgi:hypothetical protein